MINEIVKITNSDPNLAARTREEVAWSLRNDNYIFSFDKKSKDVCGWIEIFELNKKWCGLFSLFVYPKFRNRGTGMDLLRKAILHTKNHHVYGATSNKSIKKVLLQSGFKKISIYKLPLDLIVSLLFKRYGNIFRIILERKKRNEEFHFYIRTV